MSITWSNTDNQGSVSAVCTTGTETFGKAATDGARLSDAGAIDVFLAADSGQTLSGAGTLQCWIYNHIIQRWARAADFDITVPNGVASNRDAGFKGPAVGKGLPVFSKFDRIAFAPNGVTVSGGGVTVYHNVYAARRGI